MPAAVIALIFFLIGFWHLYWAMGGKTGLSVAIPEKEGQPILRPSKFATVLVALLFVVFGCLVLMHAGLLEPLLPAYLIKLCMLGLAVLMLLRGIGDFRFIGLFKRSRETRFAPV
jgi:hypothetical protein